MSLSNSRIEDLGILLGIPDLTTCLEKTMRELWIPFWQTLPKDQRTPRTLLENRELLFSLLEHLGSNLVSEKISLSREVSVLNDAIKHNREEYLADLASLARVAISCQAYDLSSPMNEFPSEFMDMDTPFEEEQIKPIHDDDQSKWDISGSVWDVKIVLGTPKHHVVLRKVLMHQEFVMHLATIAEVVTERFEELPDPFLGRFLDDRGL